MLNALTYEANRTHTENGALTHRSSGSDCLDFFAVCGAMRHADENEIVRKFLRAYAEDPDTAMKALFYARDIRGGLGERRFFRCILRYLAYTKPSSVLKNLPLIAEYGRFDDLLILLGSPCEDELIRYLRAQLDADLAAMEAGDNGSLLAKWLPSVNTSSYKSRETAKKLCRLLGMREKEYRQTLAKLRAHIDIVESRLCRKDYTFDYGQVPAGALFKYREALLRNDGERYKEYLAAVREGRAKMNTGTLYPYQIVREVLHELEYDMEFDPEFDLYSDEIPERAVRQDEALQALDTTWNALPDYCDGRNALAVIDGSGSMYCDYGTGMMPATVALSLGIYFAELSRLTDKKRTKPRATFLFAGPPGVGKTFLAEKAASLLNLPFRRYDMSEYSDNEAKQRFTGADAVFKNAGEGTVTGFVAKNPRCVLLFDEIEKAHLHVIHLFLQILDAGHIRDTNTDTEIPFTDAIMIFTTNAGRSVYEEDETGNYSELSRKVVLKAIGEDRNPTTGVPFFPAAICSRFASGNVVMFNHISAHHLLRVAKNEIQKTIRNTQATTGLTIEIDEAVYSSILFAEGGNADARTIRSRSEAFVTTELYELFRLVDSDKTSTTVDDIHRIHIGIELPEDHPEIVSLFERKDKPEILVFGSPETTGFCSRNLPDMQILTANSREEACAYLADRNIALVLCDVLYGVDREKTPYLNLEDIVSHGRDFLKYILEYRPDLPTYLLISSEDSVRQEEKLSYLQQGVRNLLTLDDSLNRQVSELCTILHQQQSIRTLARASKVVTFETAQSISADGSEATIRLFDFELIHAVDSGDGESMVDTISRPDVSFEDVIGADDAIEELKYFADYLKDPQKHLASGLHMPRGILLYGPPGTGKTMLAKALAHESDVPFLQTEGNRFLKKYVGEGPEAVHHLFRTARKYAPAIIFIDEIDAVGKERTGSEFEHTGDILTALLTEMDGFTKDTSKPVFVLAATNYDVTPGTPKSLDAALMRRFDRRIYVDLPNSTDRLRYLKKMTSKNTSFALSDEKLTNIAGRSAGMSLAGLESVLDLATRMAFRYKKAVVSDDIFDEAFEEFNSGERRSIDESTLLQTARHEAGHTLLCWQSGQIPSYLTVVARGSHGGYMQHAEEENKGFYTKKELLQRIRTSLGGRAAEIVCYGTEAGVTTGASGDLQQATALARQIVCSFGMDNDFGLAAITDQELANGTLAMEVRDAVNRILTQEMCEAIRLIREYRNKLDALADELIRRNHLNDKEIRAILEK